MLRVDTFRELLLAASAGFGDKPFLLDDERLGTVSYAQVLRFAQGLERQLDDLEIERGARIAVLLHNCGLAAILFLAVMAARRVLVPVNPLSTQDELEYMLSRAECAAIILDPSHVRASGWQNTPRIPVLDHRSYLESIISRTEESRPPDHSNRSLWEGEVVFTSGSTGRPKGIVLSEWNLISNASSLVTAYRLESCHKFLTVCPLFHNSGQVLTTLACALVGGITVPVRSDVGMLHFWSYVDRHGANWTLAMVSFLALLLSRPEQPKQPCSMRGILTGGSVIDAALVSRFESRFGIPVRTVYGLTESASISTCEYADPTPRSLGSSGRPLPTCDVRISSSLEGLRAIDTPVAYQRGEIWISGPNVFDYYLEDPGLTASHKCGRWLRTGDLGYFDEHGNLFVVDRLDSMLIVGGENVYPAEIERLSNLLPEAEQIVVAGIEHPIWGQELVLLYKAQTEVVLSTATWHRTLSAHLAPFKVPQRYIPIQHLGLADFPRKANGKLDRQAIAGLLKLKSSGVSSTAR